MAQVKSRYENYAAFEYDGSARFMKNNRLCKKTDVPEDIQKILRDDLTRQLLELEKQSDKPTDKPTEADKPTPTEVIQPEDLPMPEDTPEDITEAELPKDSAGFPSAEESDTSDGPASEADQEASEPAAEELATADMLDAISIHTADIRAIAQSLYERFGIYTVYLDRLPNPDEVNPFTGEPMTNYERGIAYQAAIRYEARNLKERDPTLWKAQMDRNLEAQANVHNSYAPVARNMEENKKSNNFDWRTSVEQSQDSPQDLPLEHYKDELGETRVRRGETAASNKSTNPSTTVKPDGRFDMDEPISEPNLGLAANPVIRPDW